MDRMDLNKNFYLHRAKLMETILEVRFTDLNQERELCRQLLEISELENDTYGSAFGNVYMLDALLAMGDYSGCSRHLIQGDLLCGKYVYDDLHLVLCNCAGLYYTKLSDELTALQYYLKGLRLARRLGDDNMECKLLNNIGVAFGGREDWETARAYFIKAYGIMEPHIDNKNYGNAISYLCNIAESSKTLGDTQACWNTLKQCETFSNIRLYDKIRLSCGWLSYYAMQKNEEYCVKCLDYLNSIHFLEFENKYFVCEMLEGICEDMLYIGDGTRGKEILEMMRSLDSGNSLINRYRIECLDIKYCELHEPDRLIESYRKYYEIEQDISIVDEQARAQSMLSKIQMADALIERENMYQENRELSNASQLDGLTGLYNRRYFNKLISKMTQSNRVGTIGLIMIDMDYFKGYNDHYGHVAGDEALKTVADILSEHAGDGIYASRFGGDEFVCLCINQTDEAVAAYVKAVRRSLEEKAIPHAASKCSDYLTVSIGYCNEAVSELLPDKLLRLADAALYKVKETGRNGSAGLRWSDDKKDIEDKATDDKQTDNKQA